MAGSQGRGHPALGALAHVADRMDLVLDTYARWGVKGVKIDFLGVRIRKWWPSTSVAEAPPPRVACCWTCMAPMCLQVLQRSYPNFITQEACWVRWNKMTKRVTPRHNLMLPFTRMLAGPSTTPRRLPPREPGEAFEVRARAAADANHARQALAMYVVYDSPLQMVSDDQRLPRRRAGEAASFDFIRRVPTAWDEPRDSGR